MSERHYVDRMDEYLKVRCAGVCGNTRNDVPHDGSGG